MILAWLIIVLVVGGLLALAAGVWSATASRWVSVATFVIDLAIGLYLWVAHAGQVTITHTGGWIMLFQVPWIPRFGISFELGLDGLSLMLIMLSLFLGLVSVFTSWHEIRERVGFFHFNLVWTLAGTTGVFLALDLFLFFAFWEVMLVPMYFLIAIWGHENRHYATLKFFLFTQGSGLLMLAAIVGLALVHYGSSGTLTFDYLDLLGTRMSGTAAAFMMLGFFLAFAVKLPAVPFHNWLPDAHTEAPTAGSVILAGVLLKTGAYGLLRFVVPLFPHAAMNFAPVAMTLAVISILYGGIVAFGQPDFKRLVAYTSISHLGFVMLAIFAWNAIALQGAVLLMLAHGISTGALFMLVGSLQDRLHTRDMSRMGGLWQRMPRMGAVGMFFAIASLGLPGLSNFVGEFMSLVGTFRTSMVFAAVATTGMVVAVIYSLFWMQRVFQGPPSAEFEDLAISDFNARELGIMAAMIVVTIWIGVYPGPIMDTLHPALAGMQATMTAASGG